MKILFTGFTSRTVGSDRNIYDYLSNVFVLKRALELAGHTVDQRAVSLSSGEDDEIGDQYDCAVVGIAAVNGLSSRYKLGAMWALASFGDRAGIFPSDGRNVGVFVNSARTCLHIPRLLGEKMRERNNIIDHEVGAFHAATWTTVLKRLMGTYGPRSNWKLLVPTFSWGRPEPYASLFAADTTVWDPTNIAWPMQIPDCSMWGPASAEDYGKRERRWILSTLQDQSGWVEKQGFKWPILEVGNKRKGLDYVPELELIEKYYRTSVGMIAFGYPLAEGGWWRMRYVHAAWAGCVTCLDSKDQFVVGGPYHKSRITIENMNTDDLRALASAQAKYLMEKAWPAERAIETVDNFVKGLKG